jgi:GNAT superfamily N-acetyltransferase
MPAIELLPAAASTDVGLVAQLTGLINRVCVVAEEGLWVEGATRTTTEEMPTLIEAGEIAVARDGGPEGQIIGCVRIRQIDAGTGEFGMLVVDPPRRGEGIGRDLIRFAEESLRRRGVPTMQLELLVPRAWTHPTKALLDAWYTGLGYRPVRTGRMDDLYPHLAPLLATPCDLVIYQKPLGSARSIERRRRAEVPAAGGPEEPRRHRDDGEAAGRDERRDVVPDGDV